MKKKVVCIIAFFLLGSIYSNAQALLLDSMKAKKERNDFSYAFIIQPASYEKISAQLGLASINEADSFSLRLWTGSMFGYCLETLTKQHNNWISHAYHYLYDSTVKEIKIKPKITLSQFINGLKNFDFNSMITQSEIKGFEDDVDDGTTYTLEIIVGKKYKAIQYHSPELFEDKYNKEANRLFTFIEKYFYY